MSDNFVLGYDYNLYLTHQIKVKIRAPIGHTIVVGVVGPANPLLSYTGLLNSKRQI